MTAYQAGPGRGGRGWGRCGAGAPMGGPAGAIRGMGWKGIAGAWGWE